MNVKAIRCLISIPIWFFHLLTLITALVEHLWPGLLTLQLALSIPLKLWPPPLLVGVIVPLDTLVILPWHLLPRLRYVQLFHVFYHVFSPFDPPFSFTRSHFLSYSSSRSHPRPRFASRAPLSHTLPALLVRLAGPIKLVLLPYDLPPLLSSPNTRLHP